jgi:hypothetical protein
MTIGLGLWVPATGSPRRERRGAPLAGTTGGQTRVEQRRFPARFSGMEPHRNSQRVIEAAVRAAQDCLWQNAPPMLYVGDDMTVARLRDLVRSPAVQAALLQSSDTFLAFVLRAVELVVSDQSQTDREILGRLWDVLDEPHLNEALGIPQNSRISFGPYPRRR